MKYPATKLVHLSVIQYCSMCTISWVNYCTQQNIFKNTCSVAASVALSWKGKNGIYYQRPRCSVCKVVFIYPWKRHYTILLRPSWSVPNFVPISYQPFLRYHTHRHTDRLIRTQTHRHPSIGVIFPIWFYFWQPATRNPQPATRNPQPAH